MCRRCLRAPQRLSAEFFCVACRTPFQNDYPLDNQGRCGLCRNGMHGFDAAYCYGWYEDVLRDLVHLYKYGRIKTLAKPLAGLLAMALPLDERFELITPVPLHWRRQWQRGFNQSELLAAEMARRRGVPMMKALKRVRATPTQAGLSNTERRRNVVTAFRCGGGKADPRLQGKSVLLIDDVMTTGSTAAACALALKRAGARRVALLTVARVDRRPEGRRALAAHSTVGESS